MEATGRMRVRTGPGGVALVLALAVALWVASTLGFMHRVVHAPDARPAVLNPGATASRADSLESHVHAGVGVAALFGHHGSEDDCRLYDQLAGGFAVPSVPIVTLPIALPTARFHFFLGEAIARWVALFDARGPPATR
ncbi:hypothetical protein ABID77_001262 [Variovorax sp. PvP013]